jgi:vacuolar iron transporter family protein
LLQRLQRIDHTDYLILQELAKHIDDPESHEILEAIAEERHARQQRWREITGQDAEPNRFRVGLYSVLAHVLGLTFAVKYMERDEKKAHEIYQAVQDEVREARRIVEEEEEHEFELVDLLDEERLHYISSIIVGVDEMIVSIIGHLSGLTLALRDTRMIGLTGLVTGLAGTFALIASQYVSVDTEEEEHEAGDSRQEGE